MPVEWDIPSLFGASYFTYENTIPNVELVRHVGRVTVVEWSDGSKTVVKCGEDEVFDKHAGFCAAVTKKVFGSTSAAKKIRKNNDADLIKEAKHAEALAAKELAAKKRAKQEENTIKRLAKKVVKIREAEEYAKKTGMFGGWW